MRATRTHRSLRRTTTTASLLALALTSTAIATTGPASATPPTPPDSGSLVIIGGALKEDATILGEIVSLADPDGSGAEVPRIAIVTAASAPAETAEEAFDPEENNSVANGLYYGDLFESYGAETYAVPVDTSAGVEFDGDTYSELRADDATVADEVAASDAVFFGGGDQMDYVRTLLDCVTDGVVDEAFTECVDTPVLSAIRTVLADGGVIAGLSAGDTIQQGANMVTGGESYEAWRDGATPGYLEDPDQLGYLPYGGFGFFTHGLLDSHFGTWGRQGRMIRLSLEVGRTPVFGVDETTALVVEGVGTGRETGRVIGRNGVSILTTDRARLSADEQTVSNVRWSYLTSGDRYDFTTGKVKPAAGWTKVKRTWAAPTPSTNVWSNATTDGVYDMVDLGVALVESRRHQTFGTTYETDPGYVVRLDNRISSAWVTPSGDVSFTDLRVRVSPQG